MSNGQDNGQDNAQEKLMDAKNYEISTGYVGSFGVTFNPITEATLIAAIAEAAAYGNTTVTEIERRLEAGQRVPYQQSPNYAYDHSEGCIRRKKVSVQSPLIACDCGHSVPQAQVMRASLGTTCPDCYDAWSD